MLLDSSVGGLLPISAHSWTNSPVLSGVDGEETRFGIQQTECTMYEFVKTATGWRVIWGIAPQDTAQQDCPSHAGGTQQQAYPRRLEQQGITEPPEKEDWRG
jgi:hypothetical protein